MLCKLKWLIPLPPPPNLKVTCNQDGFLHWFMCVCVVSTLLLGLSDVTAAIFSRHFLPPFFFLVNFLQLRTSFLHDSFLRAFIPSLFNNSSSFISSANYFPFFLNIIWFGERLAGGGGVEGPNSVSSSFKHQNQAVT